MSEVSQSERRCILSERSLILKCFLFPLSVTVPARCGPTVRTQSGYKATADQSSCIDRWSLRTDGGSCLWTRTGSGLQRETEVRKRLCDGPDSQPVNRQPVNYRPHPVYWSVQCRCLISSYVYSYRICLHDVTESVLIHKTNTLTLMYWIFFFFFFCSLGADVCCVLRLSGPLKQQYAQVRHKTCHHGYISMVTSPRLQLSHAGSVCRNTVWTWTSCWVQVFIRSSIGPIWFAGEKLDDNRTPDSSVA